MPIKLMYITNNPEIASIAESAGVDRIFVDLEYIGKYIRQGGMDTVQSKHTFEDIKRIRENVSKAEILVRINPIHDATAEYCSSKEEIDKVIECGADIVMLPYFKTAKEVKDFTFFVNGRARTMALIETPEAVECIDELLKNEQVDEMYIGLNDLSLGYGKKFMFELLADGTVDTLVEKFKNKKISYGFGGLASLEGGLLPGSFVLEEHYRLGSECVILSRSFCNANKIDDVEEIKRIFNEGVSKIREFETVCQNKTDHEENRKRVFEIVKKIVGDI